MRLSEIAHITTGLTYKQREAKTGSAVKVVRMGDVHGFSVNWSAVESFSLNDVPEKHRLQVGDMLLLGRSGHAKPILVTEDVKHDNYCAGHVFYVIRVKDKGAVLPEYLQWYLSQDRVQHQISRLMVGSAIPFLSISDLKALDIRVPDLMTQQHVAALNQTLMTYKDLQQQLIDKLEQLVFHAVPQQLQSHFDNSNK